MSDGPSRDFAPQPEPLTVPETAVNADARLLGRAIAIAAQAHASQVDKGGAPYILHPIRVMNRVPGIDAKIVAVLHDVLEDCSEWSPSKLLAQGFSREVVGAVQALTRGRGEDYGLFIERVKDNRLARIVKIADLRDNMDLTRIAEPTARDRERQAKYRRALHKLGATVEPAPTGDKPDE